MNFINLGETHLIIFLTGFSVFILWSATWAVIERRKIMIFAPFLFMSLATCFYAGMAFYSYSSMFSIFALKGIYLLTDFMLFIIFLRGALWKG